MSEEFYKETPPQQPQVGDGMAIASMVLGIVSIVLFCFNYIGIICGVVGLILGIVYKKKGGKNGMATAGIICSGIGIAVFVILLVIGIAAGIMFSTALLSAL